MYEIGDFVVKAHTGICRIADILQLDIDIKGIDKNKWYYQLVPLADEKTKIYVSVEDAHMRIRRSMTAEEATELIGQAADMEVFQAADDKMRERKYKEMIGENDPKELLRIIKTTYLRKKARADQGKKNTTVDEMYLKLAETYLFSELCAVLGKEEKEIQELIFIPLHKNKG